MDRSIVIAYKTCISALHSECWIDVCDFAFPNVKVSTTRRRGLGEIEREGEPEQWLKPFWRYRFEYWAEHRPNRAVPEAQFWNCLALVESFARGELAADWTNILSNPRDDFRFY